MTATPPPADPSMACARLAQLSDVILHLPESRSAIPQPDGTNADIDRLGESIRSLANRLATRQKADATVVAISQQVVQGLYVDEILDHVYDGFRGLLPYDRIGCALLEENGTVLRVRWARSEASDVYLTTGFTAKLADTSLASVMESGRPRILNDLSAYTADRPVSPATALILKEGVRSSLTCPLIALGQPVGILFFSSCTPFQYATMHTEIFQQLAGIISAAIEKGVLYERLSSANDALRAARDALATEATHDALTGIKNRRAIMRSAGEMQQQGRRDVREAALILIDIDHFKAVNDTLGHSAGDEVLREVARRIAAVLRTGDEVGRYGGEEFLVCLDDISHEGLRLAATRILQSIRQHPIIIANQPIRVTASAGLAHSADIGSVNLKKMIAQADRGLYEAKEQGRDRYREVLPDESVRVPEHAP